MRSKIFKLIILLGSVVLLVVVFVLMHAPTKIMDNSTESAPQFFPEVYKPKVLIDAVLTADDKIGSMPGKFLIHVGLGLELFMPQNAAVDNEGNLYIFDIGNNRIQKFSGSGEYIKSVPVKDCYITNPNQDDYLNYLRQPIIHYKRKFVMDNRDEFYILDEAERFIYKLSKSGQELKKIKLPEKIDMEKIDYSYVELKLGEDNNPFLIYEAEYRKEGMGDIIIRINNQMVEVVEINQEYNIFSRGEYEIEKINPGLAKVNFLNLSSDQVKQLMVGLDEKRQWALHLIMLGQDSKGNLYLKLGLSDSKVVVRKYDGQTGVLLSEFQISPSIYSKSHTVKEFLDQLGNFYELQIVNNSSIRVVKWEGAHE